MFEFGGEEDVLDLVGMEGEVMGQRGDSAVSLRVEEEPVEEEEFHDLH